MPYWDKSKQKWVGQVRIGDRTLKKLFTSKLQAKRWELEQKQPNTPQEEVVVQVAVEATPTISLLEFATQYLDFSKVKHSSKTYEEKQLAFRKLFKSIDPQAPVGEIHKGEILAHFQQESKRRSGYAANKDRKNLIAAWNWGCKYIKNFPSMNPFFVDRFPEQRSPRYVPSEDDFWKVYNCLDKFQDEVMLLCYLHLAARRSEIFHLRWSDIDFFNQKVRLYTRKRRDGSLEYDWLPLTKELQAKLLELKDESATEWVFPSPVTELPYAQRNKWLQKYCTIAGVEPFGIHAIRHLTASILTKNNVPLFDIKTILRHKSMQTTERYIHRLESLRSVLEIIPNKKAP